MSQDYEKCKQRLRVSNLDFGCGGVFDGAESIFIIKRNDSNTPTT